MYCTQCGKQLPEDAKFCNQCGIPIPIPTAAAPSTAPSTAPSIAPSTETSEPPLQFASHPYQRLGGWLGFLAYGQLVSIALLAIVFIINVAQIFPYLQYLINYSATYIIALIAQFIGYAIICVICCKFSFMIRRRNPKFLRFYELMMITLGSISIITLLLMGFQAISQQVSSLISGAVGFMISTAYFRKSVRVRTYMGSDAYLRQSIFSKHANAPAPAVPDHSTQMQSQSMKQENNPPAQSSALREKARATKTAMAPLLCAFAILALLIVVPAFMTFIMSMKDSGAIQRIWNGPWVGLNNIRSVFRNLRFFDSLKSTLMITLIPSAISIFLAIPIAISVGKMRAGVLRSGVLIALLLPAFVPDVLLSGLLLMNPMLPIAILTLIKPLAVCAFAGACAATAFHDKGMSIKSGAVTGVVVASAAAFVGFLTTFELPDTLFRQGLCASTLDSYILDMGFRSVRFNSATAPWTVKAIAQCLMAIGMAFIVTMRVDKDNSEIEPRFTTTTSSSGMIFGLLAALVFAVCIIFPLFIQTSGSGIEPFSMWGAVGNSLLITISTTLLFSVLFTLVTVGLSNNLSFVSILYVLLLSALGNNTVGQFMQMLNIGILNTNFATILSLTPNVSFILIAAYLTRSKQEGARSSRSSLTSGLPFIIAFTGVVAANAWGSYSNQMYISSSREQFGIAPIIQQALVNQGGLSLSMLLWLMIPVSVIAVVTGILFARMDSKRNVV